MTSAMEKNISGIQNRKYQGEGTVILDKVVREDFTEKVIFEQISEGSERISQGRSRKRTSQAEEIANSKP